jgi:hypothetical protein
MVLRRVDSGCSSRSEAEQFANKQMPSSKALFRGCRGLKTGRKRRLGCPQLEPLTTHDHIYEEGAKVSSCNGISDVLIGYAFQTEGKKNGLRTETLSCISFVIEDCTHFLRFGPLIAWYLY